MQKLFPSLKIVIFCRIVPLIFYRAQCIFKIYLENRSSILSEYKMRAPEKNGPCKRCFLL